MTWNRLLLCFLGVFAIGIVSFAGLPAAPGLPSSPGEPTGLIGDPGLPGAVAVLSLEIGPAFGGVALGP